MFTLANLPSRIATKIAVIEGCWVWTGARNSKGYGSVSVDGSSQLAHRYVYSLAYGPLPKGMTLDHMCEQRACVHPYHLNPETAGDNIRLRFNRSVEPTRRLTPDPAITAWLETAAANIARYEALSPEDRAVEDARRHALHVAIGCSCVKAVAS